MMCPACILHPMRAWPLLFLCTFADASPRDHVGSQACASCHAEIAASWAKTAHARAGESIYGGLTPPPQKRGGSPPNGKRKARGRCLGCHATSRAEPVAVGCEACHGPGAAYLPADVMRDRPLATRLGLVADPLTTCARCHVPGRTSPDDFDAASAWLRIAH
jgi:hypothetical protein